MDVDEILALERELTDEEFAFLEQETLKVMRVISRRVHELLPHVAAQDAHVAERLEISTNRMLWALEEGARLPIGDKIEEAGALKELMRDVRRTYVSVMDTSWPSASARSGTVRMPRRDRRRMRRRERSGRPRTGTGTEEQPQDAPAAAPRRGA